MYLDKPVKRKLSPFRGTLSWVADRASLYGRSSHLARSSSGACLWIARLVCVHQLQALMASS